MFFYNLNLITNTLNSRKFYEEEFGQFLANEASNYRQKQRKTISGTLQKSFN